MVFGSVVGVLDVRVACARFVHLLDVPLDCADGGSETE